MEVILDKYAGFCFGVQKAVEGVYDLIGKKDNLYTFGPVIHNESVVNDLESKGVGVINSVEELKDINGACVVIRAHGVSRSVYEAMDENNIDCIDLTCPFVKRIHRIVSQKFEEGNQIVVVGNASHPEVIGIRGWVDGPSYAVENADDARNLSINKDIPVFIVAQTTFNTNKFKELVEIIKNKGYNVNVVDTICNATKERQESAGEIAQQADVMLVIGGKNSSNTQKLFDICAKHCPSTYHIQGVEDLNFDLPKAASLVGITAGASTPNNIIEEVQNYVRINF